MHILIQGMQKDGRKNFCVCDPQVFVLSFLAGIAFLFFENQGLNWYRSLCVVVLCMSRMESAGLKMAKIVIADNVIQFPVAEARQELRAVA